MTVQQLMDALAKADPSAIVSIDGCDCAADATAVFLASGKVNIAREESEFYYADGERLG